MEFTLGRRRGADTKESAWEQEERTGQDDTQERDEDGIDWGDGYRRGGDDSADDDIDRMQLPQRRRRQYRTFYSVLTLVIAAASCILVLLLMKGQSETDAMNDARSQVLEEKLGAIEASLGALDQSVVVSGDTAAASTSRQYQELGATVDSLRTNLTDYRDNNDIQNEEIGDHLDRVIAQLDRIKEDMTSQQAQDDQQGDEIGSRLDSLTQTSKAGTSNIADELSTVHKSIAALIDATSEDQTGNYKELKGILKATDSSLSDLVSDKFDATGSLISSEASRLRTSIADVGSDVNSGLSEVHNGISDVNSGLSDVNTSVTAGLASVGSDISGVSTSLAGVSESLSAIAGNVGGIDSRVNNVQEDLRDLMDALEDLADQNAESGSVITAQEDRILEQIDTVRTDLTTFHTALSESVTQVTTQLTALQDVVNTYIAAEDENLDEEILAAMEENVQLLQRALGEAQDGVDTVDDKIDRILTAMGLDGSEPEPTPGPDPDPDPEPEPAPAAGSDMGE